MEENKENKTTCHCTISQSYLKGSILEDSNHEFFDSCADKYENYYIPDIHAGTVAGSSGAEAFECDQFECKQEQNTIKKMAGLRAIDDYVGNLLCQLVADIDNTNQKIKQLTKELESKKTHVSALLAALGYGCEWQENTEVSAIAIKMAATFNFSPRLAYDGRYLGEDFYEAYRLAKSRVFEE